MSAAGDAYVAAQLGLSLDAFKARRAALPRTFFPSEDDAGDCSTCDGTGLGQTEESNCYTCRGSGVRPLPAAYFNGDQEP